MKKSSINGQMYDVITEEEFLKNPRMYDANNAVINGDTIYPVKTGTNLNMTGVYVRGLSMIRYVEPKNPENYSVSKIIDFDKAKNVSELIEKTNVYKDMERDILTSPDNLYQPKPKPGDSSEAVLMKEVVTAKKCDINKYKNKWGVHFNNDKRALDSDKLSLSKIVRIGNNMDMKVELVISDISPNVPNPMGREFRCELTSGYINDED